MDIFNNKNDDIYEKQIQAVVDDAEKN